MKRVAFVVSVVMLLLVTSAVLGDIASDYNAAKAVAKAHQRDAQQQLKHFNPQQQLPQFSSHPSESNYYHGVSQQPVDLDRASEEVMNQNAAGKSITKSFEVRPDYPVNTQSLGVKHAQFIENNAAAIAQGLSNQYVNCSKTANTCTTVYHTAQCNEVNPYYLKTQQCTTHLQPTVTYPPRVTTVVRIYLGSYAKRYTVFTVNLRTGQLMSQQGASAVHVKVTPTVNVPSCQGFSARLDSVSWWSDASLGGQFYTNRVERDVVAAPTCPGLTFSAKLIQHHHEKHEWKKRGMVYTYTLSYQPPPVIKDHWDTACQSFNQRVKNQQCHLTAGPKCVAGKRTQLINGVAVTRDCWAKQMTFECSLAASANNCAPLRQQGCEQTASNCRVSLNGVCYVHDQTFRCPIKQCHASDNVVCGGKTFCFNGDCLDHRYAPNQQFNQALSALSALTAGTMQFDSHFIYRGHAAECSDAVAGFGNCCRDKGWGIDLRLSHCEPGEKALGKAKEKKLTVYVGKYCHNKVPGTGICTSTHKVYCVFSSKLSRIVQQQGRGGQLGLGFGSGKHPNCQGLTPAQLQGIDFSQLDFSEFYDDLHAGMKTPDANATANRIRQRIQGLYGQGQAYGH